MNPPRPARRPLAAAITLLVACTGITTLPAVAGPVLRTGNDPGSAMDIPARLRHAFATANTDAPTVLDNASANYIITFVEPPLAQYDGSNPQFAAVPRRTGKDGRNKLDVQSAQARAYVDALQRAQQAHLAAIEQALGQPLAISRSMQYALNAVVTSLTPAQARQVAQVAGVAQVMRDGKHAPATDIGPGFIGASTLWWGQPATQDTIFISGFETATGFRGDGIVVGDIDTGYNSESPSFSATDASGYTITNPLGHGQYLGQCNLPGISLAGCNDKVIGVYDLVSTAPPYSVEDTQGHGSHTASTAAGNGRSADYHGYMAQISGVAPHANLEIFYVCSPDPNVACGDSAIASAVDHAIQDGVVSTLNFSISGGTDPWNGAVEQAFLSANDAGIFVAAAAGNGSTPEAGSVNHWEPWVATIAASTHTGGPIGTLFSMTGPGTVPADTTHIPLSEGSPDRPLTAALPPSTPVKLSPVFHNQDTTGTDGCSAYAAGTFTGAIALISRGTCAFYTKVINAENAGAIAVLISDNRVELPIIPALTPTPDGSPAVSVPVWAVLQAQGTALQTFLASHAGTGTGEVPYPPARLPQQPDVLGDFSLLGPGGSGVIKPDVEAPGVNILAAVANDGSANGPNLVDLYDGTSMATPHTSGSGALLMGLHPDWTPSEVKSALMLTAKESDLTKPDATTPADFYDRGAGRIRVDVASKAGLVMNETAQRYKLANPATGGDPSALNVPGMENLDCRTGTTYACSFTRTFTSTASHSVHWTVAVTGDLAPRITLAPAATFTSLPNGSNSLQVKVDSSAFDAPGTKFAELVLTPDDGSPVLHVPIAAALPPPVIGVQSTADIRLNGAASASVTMPVKNLGGPTLDFTQKTDSFGFYLLADYASQGHYGYLSTRFTDRGNTGVYASQQFIVNGIAPMNLSTLGFNGFGIGGDLQNYPSGTPLHVAIYTDAGGKPAGNPEAISPAPVWKADMTIGDALVIGSNIVVFPSTPTALAPGKYWLTVYPDLPCAANPSGECTKGWAWFLTDNATAPVGDSIDPSGPAPGNQWTPFAEHVGLATYIDSQQNCDPGTSWLKMMPASGSVGGWSTLDTMLTATAAQMATPTTSSYLCINSNTSDLNDPAMVQVTATK